MMPNLRPRKAVNKEVVEISSSEEKSPSPLPSPKPVARASKGKAKAEPKPKAASKTPKKKEVQEDKTTIRNEKEVEEEFFYELSEKELKEINNAFDMNCSDDGEELLEADDLKTAIRSLGYEPRADEIKKLLKKHSNKDNKVNREGFQKIMAQKIGTSPGGAKDNMNDAISKVFNLLDLDKTGYISLENLRSISKELNEEITDEELHEMMAEADEDGDFQISKDEFCTIMKKTSLY